MLSLKSESILKIGFKNWQSYQHEFGVFLFADTVYILCAGN